MGDALEILKIIQSNVTLREQINSANPNATFIINGKSYTATELRGIIQKSLTGSNSNINKGLVVERNPNYKELMSGKNSKSTARTLDNIYDASAQEHQGDCYLMATINGIRNMEGGQELLSGLRSEKIVNGKKVYTFNFPGAKLAAEALKKAGYKTNITGTYTFTAAEVSKILRQRGTRYSKNDPDTILLEAAFEKYRKEVQNTLDANNIPLDQYQYIAGMSTGKDRNNPLSGGREVDAAFILTGKKSEHYVTTTDFNKLPILSKRALSQNHVAVINPKIPTGERTKSPINEIDGDIKKDKKQLNKMLDKIQKDYNEDGKQNNVCTASFRVSEGSAHAFTIKRVTDKNVILINPWYPNKELVMTREQFIETAMTTSIVKIQPESLWDKIKDFISDIDLSSI